MYYLGLTDICCQKKDHEIEDSWISFQVLDGRVLLPSFKILLSLLAWTSSGGSSAHHSFIKSYTLLFIPIQIHIYLALPLSCNTSTLSPHSSAISSLINEVFMLKALTQFQLSHPACPRFILFLSSLTLLVSLPNYFQFLLPQLPQLPQLLIPTDLVQLVQVPPLQLLLFLPYLGSHLPITFPILTDEDRLSLRLGFSLSRLLDLVFLHGWSKVFQIRASLKECNLRATYLDTGNW